MSIFIDLGHEKIVLCVITKAHGILEHCKRMRQFNIDFSFDIFHRRRNMWNIPELEKS